MLARVSIVACDNGRKTVPRRTDTARDMRKESWFNREVTRADRNIYKRSNVSEPFKNYVHEIMKLKRLLPLKKEYRNDFLSDSYRNPPRYCSFVDRYTVCIYKTTQARGTKPGNRKRWSRSSRFPWEMQFIVTALFLLSLHMASSSHRKERERKKERWSYFKSGSFYTIVMLYFSVLQKYDLYLP